MNEVIRQLVERKSVRSYEDRAIPEEAKKAIINAAMEAPTAGNMQIYTIIDITDQEIKEKLAHHCDDQKFIAEAPLVLLFCADYLKWIDTYKEAGCNVRPLGTGDLTLAIVDATIAAQNAVTAAWSLGIGSCYIGDVVENYEKQRELLNLPEYIYPAAMVVFGYPTEQQKNRQKPKRFKMEDIVCENTYKVKDGQELRHMLEERCGEQGFDSWVTKFCRRKYDSGFSSEMNRSVNEYLRPYGVKPKEE